MKTRFAHLIVVAIIAPAAIVVIPLITPTVDAVACTVAVSLSPGAVSDAVVCLEQRLIERGVPGINGPDTTYDPTSVAAVKAFQTERGLYSDGIVTSITGRQLGLRGSLPPPNAPRVTVIGDSTSAAMRWYDEAANVTTRYDVLGNDYDLVWSVESCRRLVATSCGARNDPVTGQRWTPVSVLPLMQTSLRGRLGEALVIMAGYNDSSIATAIDSIMTEAKQQGVYKVFWLTYRFSTTYDATYQRNQSKHNANLEAAKVRYPNLVVLDWNGYTSAQPASTQRSWFAYDQIHLSGAGGLALAQFLKANIDSFRVEQCEPSNANAGEPALATDEPAAADTAQSGFHSIVPTRVLDTRSPTIGGGHGKTGAGHTVTIDLSADVPIEAAAAVLNVTAVNPCRGGFLIVFACGTQPGTSNVNYIGSRTTAGMAITTMTDRMVCIYSSAMTDLVVDLVGAFVPDGDLFHSLDPTRWIDTRGAPAQSARIGRLSAGEQIDVAMAGIGGVPIDATAVWINLTATNAPTGAVLQAYPGPCGTAPNTSVVNVLSNRSAATSAIVELGDGGVCVRALTGQPHVVLDVSGWFGGGLSGGRAFVGHVPVRIYDSRSGNAHPAGATVALAAQEVGVYNIGAVEPTSFGWVSAKPCGVTATSSILNTAPLENTANMATVAAGALGKICLDVSVQTHLIVDRVGIFVLK